MNYIARPLRNSSLVKFIVLFQLLTDVVVILNIGFAQQVVGFIYLTFIPGIAVLRILKLDHGDWVEFVLLSVGLSLSLVMIVGFVMNFLGTLAGIASPLSTSHILVMMNAIVLFPCLFELARANETAASDFSYRALILAGLPLLSVVGAFLVNGFGNNLLLLLMLFIIPMLIGVIVVFPRLLSAKYYPLALFAICVALLLHQSLITNSLVGYDINGEYNVFKITENAAYWNPELRFYDARLEKGNAMLSVTILPTVYSTVLDLDGTWIFKVVYPLLLSFIAVALYELYCTQTKQKNAFLAVFFVLSQSVFFNLFAAKQMIAEIFLVLLLLVILRKRTGTFERSFLFILLSIGLVVSHYSTSYLFLFEICFVWISTIAFYFLTQGWHLRAPHGSAVVKTSMVLLFFTLSFGWYLFTSHSTSFEAIVDMGSSVTSNIWEDFFNPASRTTTALQGVGLTEPDSAGHLIGRVFFYTTEIFISIGILKLLLRRNETKFTKEYTLLSLFNMAILLMSLILPNLASTFRMERFYQLAVLILAPLCILGGETVFKYVLRSGLKRKSEILALNLILIVLLPLFWFQTGFVFEVSRDPAVYSLPLSMYRMDREYVYEYIIDEQEVASAEWLLLNRNATISIVFADFTSVYHVLTSYGLMPVSNMTVLSNTTSLFQIHSDLRARDLNYSYVYLRRLNVEYGRMMGGPPYYKPYNTSAIQASLLDQLNIVYSSGASTICATGGK